MTQESQPDDATRAAAAQQAERERRENAQAAPHAAAAPASAAGSDRPEVLAGAAFAGAFIFARVLKRLVD